MKFLNDNAFATPQLGDRSARSCGASSPSARSSRIRNAQNERPQQLAEQLPICAIGGAGSAGWQRPPTAPPIFSTTSARACGKSSTAPQVKIDAYRRNLQHAYLDLVNNKLNNTPTPGGFGFTARSSDEKPFYRAELKSLSAAIAAALPRTLDHETKAHLEGARDLIARILDPRFAEASPQTGGPGRGFSDSPTDLFGPFDPNNCFPDYAIRP